MAASESKPKRVRLRPQNPFDLIRLLARSQSDPRKAVAELVQNSLDAGARSIELTWFTEQGRRSLRIWDDGDGVFPELERVGALQRIAHTIGHSHKQDLTPAERREQLVLGKYGIGLIGFWSVGEVLEIQSRVRGGKAQVLRLREEKSQGEVFASRSRRLEVDDTYTEVTIKRIHPGVLQRIRPPRLQAYLANELRGQLLERGARVEIRDRVARGRARKLFVVEPRPYLGQPLTELSELDVPGFESARLELYLVPNHEERAGMVTLACGGTVVLDDLALIDGDDQPRAPWNSGSFEGVIDFPDLHVAPSTRRGIVHDEPVAAFLAALSELEGELEQQVAADAERRARQREEHLAKDIRRAFRSVARRLPEYDFFQLGGGDAAGSGRVRSLAGREDAPTLEDGEPLAPGALPVPEVALPPAANGAVKDSSERDPRDPEENEFPEQPNDYLLPPGPLARVEVRPQSLRLAPGASRTLRARALDGDGRPCRGAVAFEFLLRGPGELVSDGSTATYRAPDSDHERKPPVHIIVRATQAELAAEAVVPVRLAGASAALVSGIPEPRAVTAPGARWRSRMRGDQWEYNDAHPDFVTASVTNTARLRYLIHLFAKEVVMRNFGAPGVEDVLERMVEVLTSLEAGKTK